MESDEETMLWECQWCGLHTQVPKRSIVHYNCSGCNRESGGLVDFVHEFHYDPEDIVEVVVKITLGQQKKPLVAAGVIRKIFSEFSQVSIASIAVQLENEGEIQSRPRMQSLAKELQRLCSENGLNAVIERNSH
jgi:hypothetical protein